MIRAICVGVLGAALPLAAHGQEAGKLAPQQYIPLTLSEEDVKGITNYLGTLPYNQAAPIINFLAAKEAELQRRAQPASPSSPAKK